MKIRESGMPDEAMWETFFDPASILDKLGMNDRAADIVEFGCGYGTFTLAAAAGTKGTVHAFDIDPAMLEATRVKLEEAKQTNVRLEQRDFIANGSDLPDSTVDYVFLFNILHGDDPILLLR
ncbi:MAG: class I SAM-dependent methyltransferase, partial [Alphaproteobacteria bacterium]